MRSCLAPAPFQHLGGGRQRVADKEEKQEQHAVDQYRLVGALDDLLPQALKRMTPPTINVYTRIIKTSSLAVLIGVVDVIKVGQQIFERTYESVLIYGVLFLFFFFICYPLSAASKVLLPQPLGPRITTTSPLCTLRSMPLSTCASPKYLLKP